MKRKKEYRRKDVKHESGSNSGQERDSGSGSDSRHKKFRVGEHIAERTKTTGDSSLVTDRELTPGNLLKGMEESLKSRGMLKTADQSLSSGRIELETKKDGESITSSSIEDEPEGKIFTPEDRDTLLKKISQLSPYEDTTAYFEDRYSPNVRDIDHKLDKSSILYMDDQESKYIHVRLNINEEPCYSIYVNLDDAILLIDEAEKEEDRKAKESEPLPFSEILWHTTRLAAEHKYKPEDRASGLSNFYKHDEIKIRHVDVGNSDTVATAYHYSTNGNPKALEGIDNAEDLKDVDNIQHFEKESDVCRSMMATPNGRSIPYLLEQHKDAFGPRELKRTTIQLREIYKSEEVREWEYVDYIDFIIGNK